MVNTYSNFPNKYISNFLVKLSLTFPWEVKNMHKKCKKSKKIEIMTLQDYMIFFFEYRIINLSNNLEVSYVTRKRSNFIF